ncbi:carbohydrate ABC transporter permease [Streptomyces hoynatensis]|uniref:Carbohydrate ABC transporter permease n=1 Tax=Streptomyces hoynatensis TaxID=1141874 RepID=A0A3A9Z7L3_9ACTN|nr:carbohydrate ABC transporter permease [Streptomyces hoynatensis]RKN44029.1 carbohydrate ABC transporter permease [Streptomyces hoynatensis]
MTAALPPAQGRLRSLAPLVVLTAAAGYFLLPLWWLFVASTKSRGDLAVTPGLWFSDLALFGNLKDLFTHEDGVYVRWLVNTALYAGLGAALATLFSAMAGYVFAKHRFRGREAAFGVVLAGVLVPPAALALPLFLLFSSAELTNTYWAVLVPSAVSPLGVYLARVQVEAAVPDELIEAARMDGAGEYRIFFAIVLRLVRPALVTIFLFQSVAIWNNFFLPLIMLTDSDLYPVTLGLFSWNTQVLGDPDLTRLVVAGSLVSVVPLALAFVSLERYWRGGPLAGGVKG